MADFTYCSTWSGIVYVAFIIDVYSRRLVGWKAARSMTAPLVLDALNMAAWSRRHRDSTASCVIPTPARKNTHHSQKYISIAYTERLDDVGAASIGTVGDSYDCDVIPGLTVPETTPGSASGSWSDSCYD